MQSFMLKRFFFVLCFFGALGADEALFENEFSHYSGNPIKEMAIFGERCSGTNYVNALVQKNFPLYKMCHTGHTGHDYAKKNEYGCKHFLPWIELTAFDIHKKRQQSRELDFLNHSNECLFILVVRDPYDWVRSFYENPHHVLVEKMMKKGFLHFMQHEWRAKENRVVAPDWWNPYDGRRFANVLELRKYKTLNYLQVGLLVDNFLVVRYEEASSFPGELIDFISEYFDMKKEVVLQGVDTYKNANKEVFHKSKYKPFKNNEFQFINQSLDWDVESLIGYLKEGDLQEVNKR